MKSIKMAAASLLAAGAYLYWEDNALQLTRMCYRGEIPQAFDGYRILQIADLQNKTFGRAQKPLLRRIKQAQPQFIVMTGDLLDRNRTDVAAALDFMRQAMRIAPVYLVSGNHEHQSGEWERLAAGLTALGVKILDNGKSVLEKDGDTLTLLGLADKRVNPYYTQVLRTLMQTEDGFTILLSHRPELLADYAAAGVDLVFTGHAHGGQIRLPFLGGLFAPHQGFFPQYTAGMHEQDGTAMVISRGLGNSTFPFRMGNRPELILLTLQRA